MAIFKITKRVGIHLICMLISSLSCFSMTMEEALKINAERVKKQKEQELLKAREDSIRRSKDISMLWNSKDLAEQYAKDLILQYSPDAEKTIFHGVEAKWHPLYRAYIVNSQFQTEDAYGVMRVYKIQMKVRVSPNNEGNPQYDVFDLKEL